MKYTLTSQDEGEFRIVGDPENGCILPPAEYKALLAEPTVLRSLQTYMGVTQEELSAALLERSLQYNKPATTAKLGIYYHGYKTFTTNRRGKERSDLRPHANLQKVQKNLLPRLLQVPISPTITSGNKIVKTPGGNIANAKKHKPYEYTMTLDLKQAFPNTKTHRVYKNLTTVLQRSMHIIAPLLLTKEQQNLFLRTVTHLLVWNDRIPQGAPTSSAVCDIVTSTLDSQILQKLATLPVNNPILTRYRDDITISFDSHMPIVSDSIKRIKSIWHEGKQEKIVFNNTRPQHTPHTSLHYLQKTSKYKDTIKLLQDTTTDTTDNKNLAVQKERLHLYIDSLIAETEKELRKIFTETPAITNEFDQKRIQESLTDLPKILENSTTEFGRSYGFHDRHIEKLEEIFEKIHTSSLSYPTTTIGDVADIICKIAGQEGRKVNMKKLRTQTPGSVYPIEITGVAKMRDGKIKLPKAIEVQNMKKRQDLTKLNAVNLLQHPFYSKVFFKEEDFAKNKEAVISHLRGIKSYIDKIYADEPGKIPEKINDTYQGVYNKWLHANDWDDIDKSADEKYIETYRSTWNLGEKQEKRDNNTRTDIKMRNYSTREATGHKGNQVVIASTTSNSNGNFSDKDDDPGDDLPF